MVAEFLVGGCFHVKGDPCQRKKKERRTIFPAVFSSRLEKGRRDEAPAYGERCSRVDLILRTLLGDTERPWPQSPKRTSRDHGKSGELEGPHFSGRRCHISGEYNDASLNGLFLKNTQEPRRLGVREAQRTCSDDNKLPHRFDANTFLF